MPRVHSRLLPVTDLLILLTVTIWGTNYAVVKQTLSEMLPMTFNALRFSLASLLLFIILLRTEGGFLLDRKDFKGILILGLIGHTSYQFLFINGISRTTASLSALMMATCPVFVTFLNLLFEKRKPSLRILFGAVVSLSGVLALVYGSESSAVSADKSIFGSALLLAASMCWAAYTVLSKPYLDKYTPLRITCTTMVLGTIFLDLLAIPSMAGQRWNEVSLSGWTGLAYSFGFAIVLGYVLWEIGIQRIGPGKTAIYQNLTPVIAAIFSYLFLGEMLNGLQIVGAGMVFLGIYLTRRA